MQSFQCSILAHIKAGQLIVVAVQRFQCCEIFHTCEVGDSHIGNIELRHRCDLLSVKNIIVRCVEVLVNVGAEGLVREVCFIYLSAEYDRTGDRPTVSTVIGIGHLGR